MIKRKIKIKRPKRKNPYLADVGYHITKSKNLKSILDDGFTRGTTEGYLRNDLRVIGNFFFNGRRPVYFLDIADLKKITPLMKKHLYGKNLLLKVDVSDYDLQPDYNQLVIDYSFEIFDDTGSIGEVLWLSDQEIEKRKFYFSIREGTLNNPKYRHLKNVFFKYGKKVNHGTWQTEYYWQIPLSKIKNNDEIKEELIYFTDTFCVNEDIPPSKILEFYEIEK